MCRHAPTVVALSERGRTGACHPGGLPWSVMRAQIRAQQLAVRRRRNLRFVALVLVPLLVLGGVTFALLSPGGDGHPVSSSYQPSGGPSIDADVLSADRSPSRSSVRPPAPSVPDSTELPAPLGSPSSPGSPLTHQGTPSVTSRAAGPDRQATSAPTTTTVTVPSAPGSSSALPRTGTPGPAPSDEITTSPGQPEPTGSSEPAATPSTSTAPPTAPTPSTSIAPSTTPGDDPSSTQPTATPSPTTTSEPEDPAARCWLVVFCH